MQRIVNIIFGNLLLVTLLFNACQKSELSDQKTNTNAVEHTESVAKIKPRTILCFGNSLTAGYGVEPEEAFPYLIQQKLDSLKLPYKVINGGLSGETSASGVNRIEWVLREPVDIMLLELGGNDGLRGVNPAETYKNLQRIIDQARGKYPDIQIIVAGMEAPPNMGQDYIDSFRKIFKDLAAQNNLPLIPFLLEGVGGEPEFNLDDGIHPNVEGHKIVAENVWQVLKPLLDART